MATSTTRPEPLSAPDRLLAFGDIHGCHQLLVQLLEQVRPTATDQLVFLGDYIDRGPESRQVIETLLALREHFPATVFLKGNHEQMLLGFLADDDQLGFLVNGGTRTLQSYREGEHVRIPEEHLQFFQNLETGFETGEFIFVHAGMRPGLALNQQSEKDLLWIRADFLNSDFDWGKTVVFGHTPQTRPIMEQNRIGLDTGAVYGRQLTCCDVLTRRIWSAG